jgi:hypothetical protein
MPLLPHNKPINPSLKVHHHHIISTVSLVDHHRQDSAVAGFHHLSRADLDSIRIKVALECHFHRMEDHLEDHMEDYLVMEIGTEDHLKGFHLANLDIHRQECQADLACKVLVQ